MQAIGALGGFGADASSAAPDMVKLLKQRFFDRADSFDAYIMSKAIAKIGPAAILHLIEALADENQHTRGQAARALGELNAEKAIPSLVTMLSDAEENVRVATALALGRMAAKSPAAQAVFDRALKDIDDNVRAAAETAVKQFDREASARKAKKPRNASIDSFGIRNRKERQIESNDDRFGGPEQSMPIIE